jgi:hypothetical protein
MSSEPIGPRNGGGVKLSFSAPERELLAALAAQMRAMLTDAPNDPALARLFPAAYLDDEEAESFYRQMAHDGLMSRRLAACDALELASESASLSEAETMAFMGGVNDLRLVLGTRLQVTEDDDPEDIAPDDPSAGLMSAYHYLGWLLELTIDALADP